ncbi:MAG: sigma 54-dependent Fis family transcriptional regulator [Myxococcales bacterium]|jgi:DNA-binding NtrC family response regulator|nr:sigma 54-dependent Fis family transcriptional regulator [Myxococcales bacterium]
MSPPGGDTEVHPSLSGDASDRVPKITVVRGPSAGRAFAMTRQVASVGRHTTNDLVVADPRVSGAHLELRRHGDKLLVRDNQTTNGTWLGAHRVAEVYLAEGGELTIGDSTLRYESEEVDGPPSLVQRDALGQLVGSSNAMREVFATIERVANKDLSVLIQGETGSGKEEVARAVHGASARPTGPFIVIDATSLPETLAESLLFGHEKGAFTGATERRIGFFEAASGGTVFIDEIGELPAPLQSKFLRVLERHEIVRVGGHTPIRVDVRVLAATNRDLRAEIDRGRFREDLYFRLAQVKITLPPLRDRPEDIALLAQALLKESPTPVMIDKGALDYLTEQRWPGNVRELKNVLVRAAALAQDGIIRRGDVIGDTADARKAPDIDFLSKFSDAKDKAIERFERAYLEALMRRTAGNLSKASREADIARHHLRDLLKKRGLYNISFGESE